MIHTKFVSYLKCRHVSIICYSIPIQFLLNFTYSHRSRPKRYSTRSFTSHKERCGDEELWGCKFIRFYWKYYSNIKTTRFQIAEASKIKPLEVDLKRLEDLSDSIVRDFALMRKREEEMRDTNGKLSLVKHLISLFNIDFFFPF